jgi:hypothetical protein
VGWCPYRCGDDEMMVWAGEREFRHERRQNLVDLECSLVSGGDTSARPGFTLEVSLVILGTETDASANVTGLDSRSVACWHTFDGYN